MKISVIMPSFNSANFISDAIESVLNQTYTNLELIICDDGSTDNTVYIIKSYMYKDSRVKLIFNKNPKGAAGARNMAISCATGDYIAFLDSDDIWYQSKIEKQINMMVSKNILFSFTNYQVQGKNHGYIMTANKIVSFKDIIKTCDIGCSTVIINKIIIHNYGVFPYLPKEDYAYWIKIMMEDIVAYNCNFVGTIYNKRNNSLSSSKHKEIKKQLIILKKQAKLNNFKAFLYLTTYIISGIIKHYIIPIKSKFRQ